MSSQKGNVKRNRPQKYQNKTVFKNNLHDTSKKTKELNNLEITNVCKKCKNILEWKIKYKKYKVLKAPKTCTKCHKKTVKHSYHTICSNCSQSQKVCAKCGNGETLIEESNSGTKSLEDLREDPRLQKIMKFLPERKRKSILRYLEKKGKEHGPLPSIEELVTMFETLPSRLRKDEEDDVSFGLSDSEDDHFISEFSCEDDSDEDDH